MSGGIVGTIAAVVGAATSVAAGVYGAVSASEAADEQAALLEKQAQQEREAAAAQAGIIRDKARRTQGAQAAALAGSGVKLDGSGSGSALMDETGQLAEKDALLVLKGGNDKASLLEGQANIASGQADSYLVGGALGAASSIAGGVSSYQKSQQNAAIVDKLNSQGWVSRSSGSSYSLLGSSKLNYSFT